MRVDELEGRWDKRTCKKDSLSVLVRVRRQCVWGRRNQGRAMHPFRHARRAAVAKRSIEETRSPGPTSPGVFLSLAPRSGAPIFDLHCHRLLDEAAGARLFEAVGADPGWPMELPPPAARDGGVLMLPIEAVVPCAPRRYAPVFP